MRETSCEILAHGRNASLRAVNMILKKKTRKKNKNDKTKIKVYSYTALRMLFFLKSFSSS